MKYRVLHVIPCLGHGGAEHQLALNVAGLDNTRFENHVVHLSPPDILRATIESAGVSVHSAVSDSRMHAWGRVSRLVKLIRGLRIDLLHASNIEGELYGAVAARLCRIPAVATLTNTADDERQLIDNPHLNGMKLAVVRNARKAALRGGYGHYVAISEHVKRSVVDRLGLDPKKISVIYRGIPLAPTTGRSGGGPCTRRELGVDDSSFVLLTVGRLVPQKGQRYLIEAMPQVLEKVPNAVLLLAGVGFLEPSLKALAERVGVARAVRFLGRRDDIPRLLAAADVFVFPSVYEGLGVSLIEAAAAGKPCIATSVGPLPEVITDGRNGLLVPPQSPPDLARAITTLAGDAGLRRLLGSRAAESAASQFTIGRAVLQLEDLYERILGRAEESSAQRA